MSCKECKEDFLPYNPTVPTRNRQGGYDQPICRTCPSYRIEEDSSDHIREEIENLRRGFGLLKGEFTYLQRKDREQRESYKYTKYK